MHPPRSTEQVTVSMEEPTGCRQECMDHFASVHLHQVGLVHLGCVLPTYLGHRH